MRCTTHHDLFLLFIVYCLLFLILILVLFSSNDEARQGKVRQGKARHGTIWMKKGKKKNEYFFVLNRVLYNSKKASVERYLFSVGNNSILKCYTILMFSSHLSMIMKVNKEKYLTLRQL